MLLTCLSAWVAVATLPASGASSTVTVSMTVPSATSLDASGCQTGSSATSLGILQPGASGITPADCTVVFGSSNDTASLRLSRENPAVTTMSRYGWGGQSSGYSSVLFAAHALDGQRAWAVGWKGTIRYTSDGGATWGAQASPQTTDAWRAIAATSATDLHLVGYKGVAAISTDGTTWAAQTSGVSTDLYGVDFRTSQVGIAVGASGVTRITANGGSTWTAGGATGVSGSLWAVTHVTGTTWVAVGSGSAILRSTDDGASWSAITAPTGGITLRSVDAADGVVWVAGQGGTMFRSTDDGATFSSVPSGTTQDLYDVVTRSSTEAIVVGMGGTIRRTRDAGASWSDDGSGTSTWLHSIAGANGPYDLWAVGETGIVLAYDLVATLADFNSGTADWLTSGSMFGACLRTVTDGAVTTASTWAADSDTTVDEAAASADCGDGNDDPWKPVAATPGSSGAVVASTSAPQSPVAGTAALRFGAKIASSQSPGRYTAGVVFDVIAPSV